jgi:hypothetical protein
MHSVADHLLRVGHRVIEATATALHVLQFLGGISVWDEETILRVRHQNEKELKGRNLPAILSRMRSNVYQGGPLRCVPELIQNAKDEGADYVIFVLEKDAILSYNNGSPFQDYQAEDICNIAQSHKSEAQIGWMGLGFKSVFTVSDHPQVTSGRYNFVFEDLILPQPVKEVPESDWLPPFTPENGARFLLPLKRSDSRARNEILREWRSLTPNLLLFLPGIRKVDFVDGVRNRRWTFEQRTVPGGTVELTRTDERGSTKWMIFKRDLEGVIEEVGHKKHVPAVQIAFPVDETRDCSIEPLYCYLPTGAPTGLHFLVHGDFDLTISREALLDDEFNKRLLREAGRLAADAVHELSGIDSLKGRYLFFVPDEGEILDQRIRILEASMLSHLRQRPFLRTDGGARVKAGEAAFADSRAKSLVDQSDLRRMLNRRVKYVDSQLAEGACIQAAGC